MVKQFGLESTMVELPNMADYLQKDAQDAETLILTMHDVVVSIAQVMTSFYSKTVAEWVMKE